MPALIQVGSSVIPRLLKLQSHPLQNSHFCYRILRRMRFDTLLTVEDIADGWKLEPTSHLDDWCPGTGQNVLKYFIKTRPSAGRVQIATKRFNMDFYRDLLADIEAIAPRISAVVLDPDFQPDQNEVAQTIIAQGQLWVANSPEFLGQARNRFFNVPEMGNSRSCVQISPKPYVARSFQGNEFVSRYLRDIFSTIQAGSVSKTPEQQLVG